MNDRIDIDCLRLSPLFVGLRDDELLPLVKAGHIVDFEDGRVVVSEGSAGDAMYLLCEGEVAVEKQVAEENPVELAVLGNPGDFFGEMVFVDVMPRSATVRTKGQTRLLAFPIGVLHSFFNVHREAHHTILLNISRELSKRLRQADTVIADLKRQTRTK